MEKVSEAWKEAQLQNIVPMSYVEITYNIGDSVAQNDATLTANDILSNSNLEQVISLTDKNYYKYITFEHHGWILDGTYVVHTNQDIGFSSSSGSNSNFKFPTPVVLTIQFTQKHTNPIPGITIKWSEALDECARAFKVTVYEDNNIIAIKSITGNVDNVSNVEMNFVNYNKITIEITEWCLPLKRARIEEIIIGLETVFSKTDLIKYTHEQYADIISGDLPKNSIVFEIDNSDQRYNPDNPEGVYKYLLERQKIKVRYGYKLGNNIEWIKGGTFYTSEWNAPQNGITVQFTARDLIEFMTDKFVASSTTITLYDLAEEALIQANLPLSDKGENAWVIDDSLKEITVQLPNDFNHTIAETLQLVANVGRCVLYQDREGILYIEPINNILTDYIINRFNSYENADYEVTKELKTVDVNDGMGKATNSNTGEIQTLSNELIQSTEVANNVAEWVKNTLKHRKIVSGQYRADPRLDALDKITVINKYATNIVIVTDVKYEYKGSFRGSYEGRVIDE